MKYKEITEVTPKNMQCGLGACPTIYEGIRDITPPNMSCAIGGCPSAYEAVRKEKSVYLIVGEQVNPSEAGLEGKVGAGEVLIEVPRTLIDNRGK